MIKKSGLLFLLLWRCTLTVCPAADPVDSAGIYLGSKMSFQEKFDKTYAYLVNRLDTDTTVNYSLRYARKLMALAEKEKHALNIANANYLIGYCYGQRENFVVALDYYFRGLPVAESKKDTNLLLRLNNNIGIAYSHQKHHEKAAKYFMRVIDMAKTDYTLGISYNNIAIEYQHLKKYKIADDYLKKAYAIFMKLDMRYYLSYILMNRGVIRFEKSMYDSALIMYRDAYKLGIQYGDGSFPSQISNNMGEIYYKLRKYDTALFYLNQTLANVDTLNDRYTLRESYLHLSEVYGATGNMGKAYYYLKKYNHINDIIFNDENLKKSVAAEANFNLLKQENKLKLSEEKRAYDQKQLWLIYIFGSITVGLLILALIVSIFRVKEKKRANAALTQQRNQIQEQQREITDSINYARRIQDAILPSADYMQSVLGNYILFYQPRDIVGGDFYFIEKIDNRIYFAVVDCTGHGVPGGFMSILGYNGLSKCLHDFKCRRPAEILEQLSAVVVAHFSQHGKKTIRDGMDMALCCLYTANGKTMLEYAGAQNPCWIVKGKDNALIELDADKQPIGFFEYRKPFTNHITEVEAGDMVYLFSDGYPDQFGGPSGKKFKYSQLKGLFMQTPFISPGQRQQLLANTFTEWQGNFEQLDDVCILGVKIN